MFMQAYIQKLKPKLKFMFTLAFAITILLLTQHPITAKASDINLMGVDDSKVIGGGTGTNASKDYIDNAGPSKTGWLIYLSDKDGNIVSDKVVYQNAERTSLPQGYRLDYLNTRFSGGRLGLGKKVTHFAGGAAKWGAPFDSKNKSRQAEIYAYLEQPINIQGRTMARSAEIVLKYLGADALKLFVTKPKDHYLVMEACAYHEVLTATHSSKLGSVGELQRQLHLATSYGWMQIEQSQGCDLYGNIDSDVYWYKGADVSWCDNKILQISCMLSNKWPGLPDVPTVFSEDECGRLSYTTVLSVGGYGMLAVRGVRGETIHTYWSDNGSPGDPEPIDSETNDDGTPKKGGTCNIVKSYYTKTIKDGDTTYTDDTAEKYNTEKCTNVVSIDNEPNDWKLKEWAISNTYKASVKAVTGGAVTWRSNIPTPVNGGEEETVATLDEEQTVYVLLERVIEEDTEEEELEANYRIRESQITKNIRISEQDDDCTDLDVTLSDLTLSWSIAAHTTECAGHSQPGTCKGHQSPHTCVPNVCPADPDDCETEYDTTYCDGWCNPTTTYCSDFKYTDNKLSLSIEETNHTNFGKKILLKTWQKVVSPEKQNGSEVKYIDRARENTNALQINTSGWDYVCTLYRGKDQLVVTEWKNLGNAKTDLTTAGFKKGDKPKGKRKNPDAGYYMDKFSLKFNANSSDKQTTVTAGTKAAGATTACSNTKNVAFLGAKLNGTNYTLAINDIVVQVDTYAGDPTVFDEGIDTSGNLVESDESISFYPYIQMRYDTLDEEDLKAYVMGEYKRSFTTTDWFKVSTSNTQKDIKINSSQWSTHAEALENHEIESVLPGGAMLSISTPATKTVTVVTQQVILKDKGLTQVEKTGGSGQNLTESMAKSNHASLVAQVKNSLENTHIGQYVKYGEKTILVTPGTNLSELKGSDDKGLTGKASTDDKYYFRNANTSFPVSEGDLDVIENGTTTGYITYYSKADEAGIQTETSGATFTDNTNTKTYFEAAIESGTCGIYGDDEADWSDGNNWYNEAFDGVTVMYQKTTLEVGLIQPTERTSILDPKLTPKSFGKEDLFQRYAESYYQSYGKNKVGRFKGKDATLNIGKLFKSKTFYIPNVTTQDLN